MNPPPATTPATTGAAATRRPSHALILSGGGANGAYEVGVLKALFSGKCRNLGPIEPDLFFGTSVGAFNAAFLVSQWGEFGPAAAANLERVWIETLAGTGGRNGVYRFRMDPAHFLSPTTYLPHPLRPLLELARDGAYVTWDTIQRAAYLTGTPGEESEESFREKLVSAIDVSAFISTRPWRKSIRETIAFSNIRAEDTRRLVVFATNWATGRLRSFENSDMTDKLGALALEASSAVPGIFPQVYVGAEPYVDGGILLNTPLTPALEAGGDVLHVIYLDPDVAAIPLSALDSTVAASYRLQQISWAALVNRDIDRVARINRGLAAFERIQRGETIGASELEGLAKGAVLVLGGRNLRSYRPITVHRYHPREELGRGALGLLNMDRAHIDELVQRGFTDATLHDCEKEKCVLPEASRGLSAAQEAP